MEGVQLALNAPLFSPAIRIKPSLPKLRRSWIICVFMTLWDNEEHLSSDPRLFKNPESSTEQTFTHSGGPWRDRRTGGPEDTLWSPERRGAPQHRPTDWPTDRLDWSEEEAVRRSGAWEILMLGNAPCGWRHMRGQRERYVFNQSEPRTHFSV